MKPAALLGRVLDARYRIDRVAGEGGQGIVYRAEHLAFDEPVAVKVLKLPAQCDSRVRAALLANFRREGRLLFKLSALHPSFVQAKESGTLLSDAGVTVPYLVLGWLEGFPLSYEVVRRCETKAPPLRLDTVIRLLDRPSAGLGIAHAHGIAHRDLKPGNLFLTRREGLVEATILDFGLAKVLQNSLSTTLMLAQTHGGAQPFTPAYGAPEQWLGRLGASGPWSDVHAWALICVELLTGKPALHGADSAQLMGACLDALRPTPGRRGADVPAAVEAVFERALAINPQQRFRSISEFWSELRAAAGVGLSEPLDVSVCVALSEPTLGEPGLARSDDAPERGATSVTIGEGRAQRSSEPATGRRSRLASAAALLGAVLAAVGATSSLRGPPGLRVPATLPIASEHPPYRAAALAFDSAPPAPQPSPAPVAPPSTARQVPSSRERRAALRSPPAASLSAGRAREAPVLDSGPAALAPQTPDRTGLEQLLRNNELSSRH